MNEHVTSGKCFCGQIPFRVRGAPLWVAHCHCNSCRRSTGAPITTFVGFDKKQVSFEGDRMFYSSSPGVKRGFCANCGTPMTYESDRCENEIHFYISVMDEPERFIPERHVFYDEHIKWFEVNDDLPRFAGFDRDQPASWGPKYSGG